MEIYKGYIRTNGKISCEKLKGVTNFKTFEEVQTFDSYAGILNDDIILIDIDDMEESNILLNIIKKENIKCKCYETSKGKHFIFKNAKIKKNATSKPLAVAIRADIKIGCNTSYQVLKLDGKVRKLLIDEIPQELPVWLYPIHKFDDLKNLEQGDGRNQRLYNYILNLQQSGLSIEDIRQTIKLINLHVLNDPLNEKELNVVLRDESFQAPIFYNDKTFLHANFARYLIANNHIVKINNQLHIYRDGYYKNGEKYIENQMIKLLDYLPKSKRQEVLNYLDVYIEENTPHSDARYIGFKNGVYDIVTDKLLDFSPSFIITNYINYDYVENAKSELVDSVLKKLACNDEEILSLLEEVIGYNMYRRNELGKAFILIGDKSNGKSTFLDMIKTMLGDDNIASLDLSELGDRFKTAELFNKLSNIGDDIGDEFIANASVFKKLVTGDRVSVERKGQDPFEFNNYSKMLFSANNIPRIKDKTGAVLRRLVIIPFNATFSIKDPDYRPYIKYELREKECIEHMIQLGISGLKRILLNQKFTESKLVEKEIEEYTEQNNPILLFFKETADYKIENELVHDVYLQYAIFCRENGMKAMSKLEFIKQLSHNFDIEDRLVGTVKNKLVIRK